MRDQVLRPILWVAVPLATLLLACMPLLGMRPMVLVIAAWVAVLVLRAAIDPVPIQRAHLRWFLLLAAPFLLMLLDALRAPDLGIGWSYVERSSSLLLFPAGFFLLGAPASKRFREAMMDLFAIAALLLALYANGRMLAEGWPSTTDHVGGFSSAYRAAFSTVTGLHPPYAAYFFFSAALFQIVRFLDGAPYRTGRGVVIALLFLAGQMLASRMPLAAFGAAVCLVALLKMPRQQALRASAGVIIAMLITVFLVPGMRGRVLEMVQVEAPSTAEANFNSTNIRIPIAHCTFELLEGQWLLGVGQANAQDALDDCYRQFNQPKLLDGSYGTHNQLLHWWLCFGLLGLALFIGYFGALLLRAWRRRDAAHLGFLVLILLCSATENILARQWGVVLFACFNTLFLALPEEDGQPEDTTAR